MRYQEAEERPRLLQELGHRLQYYATIAGEFRNKVSGLFFNHSASVSSLAGGASNSLSDELQSTAI